MFRRLLTSLTLVCALIGALAATAQAAEPPNQNDPCSKAGRNTCDTLGVGRYKNYKFGIRWFGDYRGAIEGVDDPSFCIDLRYWYPSEAAGYEQRDVGVLKNRDGDRVSSERIRQLNYALWEYGRTRSKTRQAATMLFVHDRMGDGARGEIDPRPLGAAVRSTYASIQRDARRYAGPYKVEVQLPDELKVGERGQLRLRVRAASGALMRGVDVSLASEGASGVPGRLNTGRTGSRTVSFTATDEVEGVSVKAETSDLAAVEPNLYVPTKGEAARSGQRLVTARGETVTGTDTADAAVVEPKITTAATPNVLLAGAASRDQVTLSNVPKDFRARVQVKLYGPARTQAAISCDGQPFASTVYTAKAGKTTSPALVPDKPGWYGYRLVIDDGPGVKGVTTPCAEPKESLKVEVQPKVRTQISAASLAPGGSVTDDVFVEGTGGESVTVQVALYGPSPAADAVSCDAAPVATQTFTANGDGTYTTEPVSLATPGYYTYRESLPASDFTRPAETACGEATETTVVRGSPRITTRISAQSTTPADTVTDNAVITGLGALKADVKVELWGPYPSPERITCTGTPFAVSTLTVKGDGTYTTEPVKLGGAGYYTYREAIVGSAAYDGVQTECGEAAETTIAKAVPKVTTVVSDALVKPGSKLFDRVRVTGLGVKTEVDVKVELYGPFAAKSEISCKGTPLDTSILKVDGDGTFRSDSTTVTSSGWYTYREIIEDAPIVSGTTTECAEEAETSFAIAGIPTGRGEAGLTDARLIAKTNGSQPDRVELDRLNIDAPVASVGIDTEENLLAIPVNIDRVGFWRDSATVGAKQGTTLLAGHVDSAKRGAGAFYRLKNARRGDRVTVTAESGRKQRYRITSIRRMRKSRLPESVYRTTGAHRLVLVTCGGPFDAVKGSYRDNIVVTAVPV